MQSQRTGNQLSSFLKSGSLLSVIIIINVALWLLMLLFPLVDYLYASPAGTSEAGWLEWFALSSEWEVVMRRPWTLLTYMFLHSGFWHILFNMVMLYFGGVMFNRFLGTRRFGWVYFLSGLFGALLFLLVYNLFPVGQIHTSILEGASAAVLGVFIAVAVYAPDETVGLWAVVRTIPVKMKYLALAFIVIDLLSIPASNAGGHIAHLGGALFGWLYVVALRWNSKRGGSRPKLKIKHKPRKKASKERNSGGGRPMSDEEYNRRRAADQKRVDAILDKISKSGYENLSKEEKEFLFRYK